MKIPRVVPQIGYLTNLTWPPPWSLLSLYYGAGTPAEGDEDEEEEEEEEEEDEDEEEEEEESFL